MSDMHQHGNFVMASIASLYKTVHEKNRNMFNTAAQPFPPYAFEVFFIIASDGPTLTCGC